MTESKFRIQHSLSYLEKKETKFQLNVTFPSWLVVDRDTKGKAKSHTSSWVLSKKAHINSLDMNVNSSLTGLSV